MQNLQRATALIRLDNLRSNCEYIKTLLSPGCKLCAMIKADGYGHGIVQVAQALCKSGVDYFGVADMSEAEQIRSAGIKTPVLMMGYTPVEDMPKLIKHNLTQTVFGLEYAKVLSENAGGIVKCHIKLDTGMSRLGYICPDGKPTSELLDTLKIQNLDFEGIYTHYARSDEPSEPMTLAQFNNFVSVTDSLEKAGHHFAIRHTANSGAIINFPQTHLDMVRPGIMLYGLMPDATLNPSLRPVMELRGAVELIKTVPAGHTVSYGATFLCREQTRVGIVSLGYADGVSRALSNRGQVNIRGRRAPILGKICMDHLIVDLGGIPEAVSGDEAYIIGGTGATITTDEVAAVEGTISYEVLCRMVGRRVTKEFIGL